MYTVLEYGVTWDDDHIASIIGLGQMGAAQAARLVEDQKELLGRTGRVVVRRRTVTEWVAAK